MGASPPNTHQPPRAIPMTPAGAADGLFLSCLSRWAETKSSSCSKLDLATKKPARIPTARVARSNPTAQPWSRQRACSLSITLSLSLSLPVSPLSVFLSLPLSVSVSQSLFLLIPLMPLLMSLLRHVIPLGQWVGCKPTPIGFPCRAAPHVFSASDSGRPRGPRTSISEQGPEDADMAGQGPHFETAAQSLSFPLYTMGVHEAK